MFVASCTKAGSDHVAEEEDGVFEKRGLKKTSSSSSPSNFRGSLSAGTSLRRAFASVASYVRVSLNRVDPGVRPKKDDSETHARLCTGTPTASRTSSTRRSCRSESTRKANTVLLELFRKTRSAATTTPGAIGVTGEVAPARARRRRRGAAARPRVARPLAFEKTRFRNRRGETATGDVCVAACFLDAAKSRLRVRVLEARDVRAGDKTGDLRRVRPRDSSGRLEGFITTSVPHEGGLRHHLSRLAARVFLPRREKHGEGPRRRPGRIHRRDLWLFRARRRHRARRRAAWKRHVSVTNTKRLKRDPLTSAGKPSRWTCSTTISTTSTRTISSAAWFCRWTPSRRGGRDFRRGEAHGVVPLARPGAREPAERRGADPGVLPVRDGGSRNGRRKGRKRRKRFGPRRLAQRRRAAETVRGERNARRET